MIDRVAIHTPNLLDYREVVKYFLKNGATWRDYSRRILEDQWGRHRSDTCVCIVS